MQRPFVSEVRLRGLLESLRTSETGRWCCRCEAPANLTRVRNRSFTSKQHRYEAPAAALRRSAARLRRRQIGLVLIPPDYVIEASHDSQDFGKKHQCGRDAAWACQRAHRGGLAQIFRRKLLRSYHALKGR